MNVQLDIWINFYGKRYTAKRQTVQSSELLYCECHDYSSDF